MSYPPPQTGDGGAEFLGPARVQNAPQPTGLAITSLVLALVGCCAGFVPLVMSVVAISRARRGVGGAHSLAVAAFIVSLCWIVVTIGGSAFLFRALAVRDATGQVSEAGYLPAGELRAGDCLDRPGKKPMFVKVIPCGLPHETELIARLPSAGSVPESELAVLCAPAFREYVGIQPGRSGLKLMAVRVSASTFGDAEGIACLVGQQDDAEIAGSLRNLHQ
jgi:hypothetical protein